MGKVNDALNDYLNDTEIFADFCNGALYGGEKVITPAMLAECQRFYQEDLQNRAGKKHPVRRERDIARLLCREGSFVIIAIENQENENLYMPLRCMEYETEDLKRQLRHMQRRYEEENMLEFGAEFLSGIKRTDRFIPTAQIVLYHGEGRWKAPESLQAMTDRAGADKVLERLMTNYRIHVIHLTDLDENKFETGLRELIGLMKCRENRQRMQAYCREHADRFSGIDDRTYDLICTMLHMKSLKKKKQENRLPEGRKINMCKAFEDWAKEEQEKGMRIGEKRGERRGEKRGIEKGEKLGIEKGENRIAALISRLFQDGRIEDARRASESAAARKRLYLEYGI